MKKTFAVTLLLFLFLLLLARSGRAHDVTPGVLSLVEVSTNHFAIAWTPPSDAASTGDDVRIEYPTNCRASASSLDGCDLSSKAISFDGIRSQRVKIVVSIRFRDGRTFEAIATKDSPKVEVSSGSSSSASNWVRVGVEHVLAGWDHIAFVLGLFLVVGRGKRRELITTITAFTIAHSITLALASLHVITIARAPVEATIAASIILVAREALVVGVTDNKPSLTRERPWIVAFVFGLIHGLGFAGALNDLPLDRGSIALSLLSFNLGIEIAQIAIVAVLLLCQRIKGIPPRARPITAYAIGALGAFWFIDRASYFVLKR